MKKEERGAIVSALGLLMLLGTIWIFAYSISRLDSNDWREIPICITGAIFISIGVVFIMVGASTSRGDGWAPSVCSKCGGTGEIADVLTNDKGDKVSTIYTACDCKGGGPWYCKR